MASGGNFATDAYSDVTDSHMLFLGSGVKIGDTTRYWVVCGVVPRGTVRSFSYTLLLWVIGAGMLLLAATGMTIFLIVRKRLRRLPGLTATAQAMAGGDVACASAGLDRSTQTKNEIDLLERAFADMADGIRQQAATLSLIARGDYSASIPVRSDADVMNKAISGMLDSMNHMLRNVQQVASQVAFGAAQISDSAQILAVGSTQQASTLEEYSAAIAEIRAQSESSAELSRQVKQATDQVSALMAESMHNMTELTGAMTGIDQSSEAIEKIIKVIDDIASQTNILALNAAVESARAGSAGRGFAVVANEVRSLAAKSVKAASETAALIQSSVENVKRGMAITEKTAESLSNANQLALENAGELDVLNGMSQQTTTAISEISTGARQISDVVQSNSAVAEQSAASAEEMHSFSMVLTDNVGRFTLRNQPGDSDRQSKPNGVLLQDKPVGPEAMALSPPADRSKHRRTKRRMASNKNS